MVSTTLYKNRTASNLETVLFKKGLCNFYIIRLSAPVAASATLLRTAITAEVIPEIQAQRSR